MQLDDYFTFEELESDAVGKIESIRVKGSRIGIEFIVEPYLRGDSPERIYHAYRHSLSLEQVYAAITYYLHNKARIDEYMRRGQEIADYFYREHLKKGPSPIEKRMRELKAQKQTASKFAT
jgi:uncharacterized protein (DUF433 family)